MFDQQIWQILKAALDKQFSPIKSRKTSEPMQPTPEKNQQTSSKLTAATQTVCQRIDQLDSNYKKGLWWEVDKARSLGPMLWTLFPYKYGPIYKILYSQECYCFVYVFL